MDDMESKLSAIARERDALREQEALIIKSKFDELLVELKKLCAPLPEIRAQHEAGQALVNAEKKRLQQEFESSEVSRSLRKQRNLITLMKARMLPFCKYHKYDYDNGVGSDRCIFCDALEPDIY